MNSPAIATVRAIRAAVFASVLVVAATAGAHPVPDPAQQTKPEDAMPQRSAEDAMPQPDAADAQAESTARRDSAEASIPWWKFGKGGPNFTFSAATSFVFDLNRPDHQITDENRKAYTNGEDEESFNIDLVQVGISGTRSRVSYAAKLDYGDWSEALSDNVNGDFALQEGFLAVDVGFGVISAGRMPTPLGYEVLEPWANPNISRSRGWFYQSVSHDGAAVSGEVGGVSLMGAVVNGMRVSDNGLSSPDDGYGVIASVAVPVGEADLKFAAIYSDEQDAVRYLELNGTLSGRRGPWRYGLDGTWLDGNSHRPALPVAKDVSVWDVTAYGGATFGNWSGDLRLGYTDQQGTNASYGYANSEGIVSFTATGGYQIVDGVVVRAEYRVDSADRDIFDDHDSTAIVAGPVGQTDVVHVVQVQLMWTPSFGGR